MLGKREQIHCLVIFPTVSARIITLLLLTVEDKNFDKSATFVVAF